MNLQAGVIHASVREGRRGEAFAHWIHHLISERPEVSGELLDLRDWPFSSYAYRDSPLAQEKMYPPGSLGRRWAEKIATNALAQGGALRQECGGDARRGFSGWGA